MDSKDSTTLFELVWEGLVAIRKGTFLDEITVDLYPKGHRLYWLGTILGIAAYLLTVVICILGVAAVGLGVYKLFGG